MVNMVRRHLMGLETWDGWLISGNTQYIFVIQNKLILYGYIHFNTILLFLNLSTHFSNTTKEFLQLLENILNNPLPPSRPKHRVVNVCMHKFACTNVTTKRRNGAHFITHAPHCAWVKNWSKTTGKSSCGIIRDSARSNTLRILDRQQSNLIGWF